MNNMVTVTGAALADNTTSSTVNCTYPMYGPKTQISLLILDDGIDIVYRQEPMVYYNTYPGGSQPNPRISKSVYRVVDGKLRFIKEVEGRYLAPRPEWYEFDSEEGFMPAY